MPGKEPRYLENNKTSFAPLIHADTSMLILGSLPGDKSLELGEYYGHPRNRFWKVISVITNSEIPLTYAEKKVLLLQSQIGLWDVAHTANRKGSLDSAIVNVEPNDLNTFLEQNKQLRVIGFNGKKSEALHDKYFTRKKELKYVSLPSTSPANADISFDRICALWQQLLL